MLAQGRAMTPFGTGILAQASRLSKACWRSGRLRMTSQFEVANGNNQTHALWHSGPQLVGNSGAGGASTLRHPIPLSSEWFPTLSPELVVLLPLQLALLTFPLPLAAVRWAGGAATRMLVSCFRCFLLKKQLSGCLTAF